MTIDWLALLAGIGAGLVVSGLFFIGLAWSVKQVVIATRPGRILLLSFITRMTLLLGAGTLIAANSASLWPLIGYVLAFFIVRLLTIRRAKVTHSATPSDKGAPLCK